MIIELSFVLVGGANLGLEKHWHTIENIMRKYPKATWRKVINWKNGKGKYVIEVE